MRGREELTELRERINDTAFHIGRQFDAQIRSDGVYAHVRRALLARNYINIAPGSEGVSSVFYRHMRWRMNALEKRIRP